MSQPPLHFTFEDGDLDAMLAGPGAETAPEPADFAPSEDLHRLTRKLAGQYAEVLARYAAQAFAGRAEAAGLHQMRSALGAVGRLCASTGDRLMLERIGVIEDLAQDDPPQRGRARARYLADLKAGLVSFAEILEPADGERLRRTVVYDGGSLPLLDELAGLPGIGPKRLERLYCAGLFRIETVASASPDEIAQVTGLPRPLAAAVVDATLRFAEQQRRRVVGELVQRVRDLQEMVSAAPMAPSDREALAALARTSLVELQGAIRDLETVGRTT